MSIPTAIILKIAMISKIFITNTDVAGVATSSTRCDDEIYRYAVIVKSVIGIVSEAGFSIFLYNQD